MHSLSYFLQLNFQRDQIAAIKDKQLGREKMEDSQFTQENSFSRNVAQTFQAHSTVAGKAGLKGDEYIEGLKISSLFIFQTKYTKIIFQCVSHTFPLNLHKIFKKQRMSLIRMRVGQTQEKVCQYKQAQQV